MRIEERVVENVAVVTVHGDILLHGAGPDLSNVVIPESSIDPSHTSSNPPHEAEPEYVNESVNLSGGFAEAVAASSSATPQTAAADTRSPFMPSPFLPPGAAVVDER